MQVVSNSQCKCVAQCLQMCGGGGAAADLMSTHTFTTGHYTHTLTSGQVTDWTLVTVAEYQQPVHVQIIFVHFSKFGCKLCKFYSQQIVNSF